MRILVPVALLTLLAVGGCGVNKQYVSEQIAVSEAKSGAQLQALQDQTSANSAELARLQQLALQLGEKTDLAINKASGFENYQIIWTGEIRFAFDSYEIDGLAAAVLDEAGGKLEQLPHALIEITGHTDKTGDATYNLVLGERRSNAARRYLADKFGVSLYRMFINSYGEEKPVALPDQKNASSKNRRVVLTIWGIPPAQ